MTKHIKLQKDYTASCLYYQIKLPLDIEKNIPSDDSVRLLSAFVEGKPSPDHATIARFILLHLSQCSSNILAEVSNILYELGEISGRHIFIDGTKTESAANRYTFVWKKAVTKNQTKLFAKITELIAECEEMYGLKLVYQDSISLHSLKHTPVYNFINDRLVDGSAVLRPLS